MQSSIWTCQFLGAGSKKFHFEVDGQELEQTQNFVYPGGNISTQEGSDKNVDENWSGKG